MRRVVVTGLGVISPVGNTVEACWNSLKSGVHGIGPITLFDTTDYDKGAALIEEKYHIPLVLITLGKDGSRAYYKGRRVECAPFLQEHTIETTGAGDTFCASILNYVLDHGLEDLSDENLMEMLTFANAGASLITTRKGALRVMPTREEVEEFIAESGR